MGEQAPAPVKMKVLTALSLCLLLREVTSTLLPGRAGFPCPFFMMGSTLEHDGELWCFGAAWFSLSYNRGGHTACRIVQVVFLLSEILQML